MAATTATAVEKHLKFVNTESISILSPEATDEIARDLFKVMASSYSLVFLIQGCHWNIMGPHFLDLHKLFGNFYQVLLKAVDDLAERMRALGAEVPYTPEQLANSSVVSIKPHLKGEHEMLDQALKGYQALGKATHRAIQTCRKHEDFVSAHLLTKQMASQEDSAWQLVSISKD